MIAPVIGAEHSDSRKRAKRATSPENGAWPGARLHADEPHEGRQVGDSHRGWAERFHPVTDCGRQDEAISARLALGFEQMVGSVQAALEATDTPADARARALTIAAAMIGGVAIARAAAKSRPDLSDEIVTAVRRVLGKVGGEDGKPRN